MSETSNPIFSIAPITETVTINETAYKVSGVPLRILTQLAKDCPELASLVFGGSLDGQAFIDKAPDAVSTFIAAGFRGQDDPKVKEAAANLPFDVQLLLIHAILKRTMLGGAGPFVAELVAMRKLIEVETDKNEETKTSFRVRSVEKSSPKPLDSSTATTASDLPKYGT